MERTNVVLNREDMNIVDGKVVISSEELANAIQDYDVDLNGEEGADGISIHIICPIHVEQDF